MIEKILLEHLAWQHNSDRQQQTTEVKMSLLSLSETAEKPDHLKNKISGVTFWILICWNHHKKLVGLSEERTSSCLLVHLVY